MKDVLLSPSLVKAARALLNWQQIDLAKAAGLSLTAIKTFEQQSRVSRERTAQTIRSALENNGIEFLSGGGLRRVDDLASITRLTGQTFIHQWNEDIYTAFRNHNGELLTSSADEGLWHQPFIRSANEEYHAWCKKRGLELKHKILIPEGQKNYNFPKQAYRTLPRETLGKIHYCLYADRLAFVLWKKRQVIVIRNKEIVETFRNQFVSLWRSARTL